MFVKFLDRPSKKQQSRADASVKAEQKKQPREEAITCAAGIRVFKTIPVAVELSDPSENGNHPAAS